MSLKSWITSNIAALVTSEGLETWRRQRAERARKSAGARHVVDYFHQADDPYAQVVAQVLPGLSQRYDIDLRPWLCSAPPDWAAPERERLIQYSRIDASRLAAKAGLRFSDPGRQPSPDSVKAAEALFAGAIESNRFVKQAAEIGEALWSGRTLQSSPPGDAAGHLKTGDALRHKLGHYLGGTFHYGGEWYWGLDRLHYLERRLTGLGALRPSASDTPIFAPPPDLSGPPPGRVAQPLEFFLSFRSPYTYIATARAKALADAFGAPLKIKFVLPMIMRALPVPPKKRWYITLDAAREARRLGVPFGRVADPVGRPVERAYSLLPWAIESGRGYEYCHSFMRSVWSEGVDAGGDSGMRRIVEGAGLDWRSARTLMGGDGWRAEAEANRQDLIGMGLWGVPSFRFGDVAVWGQDRLWAIEDAMRKAHTPKS